MVGNGTGQTLEDAYIQWLNDHLTKATPPLLICDLTEENICNGVAIGLLLGVIGGIKIEGLLLQPITIVERLHNIHEVFSVLRQLNVKLNNIQPEEIMGGDKDTVLQLLIAINDHFTPKAKCRKHFLSHESDYKIDSSGRTSVWSAMNGSTACTTPINRSQFITTTTVTTTNGHNENGIIMSYESQKNLLHSTNGINTMHTSDTQWSDSNDNLIDTHKTSSNQSLVVTPTPSEMSESINPRARCTVYRTKSYPLSPRSSMVKRESSISTAPINIRSALPRGYYPSSTSSLPRNTKSSYHDQNTRNRRGSINPVEVPQLYDSMNEIQHLRSQLNMLSKLIESDGSNANRTPPAFRATASKSTQTELGYLLDRHTKKSTAEITELKGIIKIKEETIKLLEEENARLSDSLKSILHNMNKPNNLDKNTMSNNLNKTNQNQLDAYEQKINRSITNSQTKPYDSPRHSHPYNLHEQQQQQQQQFRQNQQRYQQPHRQTYTPVNQSPPVTISHSPSQKCYMMRSYTSESSPNTNTNPSPYGLDISSSSPPFTSSPINRQSSPDKYSSNSNIRRQLSPTGKRFPYYQPYIHSLMHPNQTSKYDKNKNSNDLKGIGYSLTAAQSQIVKSPTQRLLMQSLPSSGY
ncbi:unnamed protein product [Trichobilharzia szidati]|nr:unnamed protein product [Trichobilharzia szidati]